MKKQKIEYLIGIIAFLFLILLGLFVTYNYDMGENYNLLFESDTARVIQDATMIKAFHYRADVHPLFIIIVQPMVYLLSGLVMNKTLAIILLSVIVSSLTTVFFFKILNLIKPNKKVNIILSLIYLFSFSNIIFTVGIETYNFAALFLMITWYYFIKKEKLEETYEKESLGILILLAIMNFSFTMTNIIVYLIVIFLLWITKKIPWKKILKIGCISIGMILIGSLIQKVVWQTTPAIWDFRPSNENTFAEYKITKESIKNVITNDYYHSLIGNPIELNIQYGFVYDDYNYYIQFQPMTVINFLIMTAFYILLFILVFRNFKKQKIINTGLLLTLLFNTSLHMIYGNENTFLYSLHFVYVILLLWGINFHAEEKRNFKKHLVRFLMVFLFLEVVRNNHMMIQITQIMEKVLTPNIFVYNLGLSKTILFEGIGVLLVSGIVLLGLRILQTMGKEDSMEKKIVKGSLVFGLFLLLESGFILLEAIPEYTHFLQKEWIPVKKEEYPLKSNMLSKEFNDYFETEIKALKKYTEEVETFKQEYDVELAEHQTDRDHYYFGMGNRRKLVYRKGELLDLETNEKVLEWTEKESLIVPNIYSVLILTEEEDYVILREDEKGVHYIRNGIDRVLEETKVPISLYKFDNMKYQNMMKVLYGEILFNIKDSTIYPNIIVYDKPWYRDAAITTMVLQRTENLDLIKDWVSSITEIYDKQNGVEEVDNLGELLYIISTQEEKNEELIQEIEEEAERIAKSNSNGYYLYGKTDFGDQYYYQNLWYKLGIESLGKEFKYDLKRIPEDQYSKMAWWSDYPLKEQEGSGNSLEYPYLSLAERHTLGKGTISLNKALYPLSWEKNASHANYSAYQGLDDYAVQMNASPMHSWAASEFLLLLWDEE